MNEKQYKRLGFVVSDCDYSERVVNKMSDNYSKYGFNVINTTNVRIFDKQVVNELTDRQSMSELSDKSESNCEINTLIETTNTQTIESINNQNINKNINKTLISDSPLHRLIPYAKWSEKER